jgi:hypothetical protein
MRSLLLDQRYLRFAMLAERIAKMRDEFESTSTATDNDNAMELLILSSNGIGPFFGRLLL